VHSKLEITTQPISILVVRVARKGWPEYLELFRGFYKSEVYKRALVGSRYYKAKGKLLCGLTGMKDSWKCFDRYLLTLQLIPYRSISTPSLGESTYLLGYLLE
jgi:hypothetical protein